jgi:hypothetical protein
LAPNNRIETARIIPKTTLHRNSKQPDLMVKIELLTITFPIKHKNKLHANAIRVSTMGIGSQAPMMMNASRWKAKIFRKLEMSERRQPRIGSVMMDIDPAEKMVMKIRKNINPYLSW